MRDKIGRFFVAVGIVLMFAAFGVFVWNNYDAYKAEKAANDVLSMIDAMIDGESYEAAAEAEDTEMTIKMINGYGYIGYLSIPSLDLKLPVMSEWDYDRLKIAPCRYTGSTKTNDLVIAAHNYVSHFGKFSHLQIGDNIIFKDMDKIVTRYKVVALDILSPTAIEDMTSGEFDLTLFTCTYGGRSRITVRCERSK